MDETGLGGKRKHRPERKRAELSGRGTTRKTAMVGVKARVTKCVSAAVVPVTGLQTLQACVAARSVPSATVYSDSASAYGGLPRRPASAQHGADEHVRAGRLRLTA